MAPDTPRASERSRIPVGGAVTWALAALLLVAACKKEEVEVELPPAAMLPKVAAPERTGLHQRTRPAMGTFVELKLVGLEDAAAEEAAEAVFAEFARIEASMTAWRDDSQLGRVNVAAGAEAVVVDAELFDVLTRAMRFAENTDGAFDPTFATLWGLWTFGDDGIVRPPEPAVVKARRALIGYGGVTLDPKTRAVKIERKGTKLGLGGIAKGYATDRAVALLRERGVEDFLIKAGGELYAAGKGPTGPWKVGVRDPRAPGFFAKVVLEDRAFDTSGDYERYFEHEGVRYHHIIDPKTGYPARRSRSVTVLASDATTADALSTALFVMGAEAGLPFVEARPDVEAVFVTASGELVISSGLGDRLEVLHAPTP